MKTLVFYLPQFHRVKENDIWWGEGYTEWTAVRNAEPLFEGHYQQHIPLNDNYYDLLQKDTMKWQVNLMNNYGIDGLCIYHYYFKDGKKMLEKPAENLLGWTDINIEFCFCWANQSWGRTWSKFSGINAWNEKEELKISELSDDGILLKQDYGDVRDWEKHYRYLSAFFQDDRYIKINNCPIFLIHRFEDIYCFPQMKALWNKLSIEDGFDGIYFLGKDTDNSDYNGSYKAETYSFELIKDKRIIDYSAHCKGIINRALLSDSKVVLCGNTGYDDTPRRGENGYVIDGFDPDEFYRQMRMLYYIAEKRKNEFVLINAWNEWGEGMHLEPDKRFGYRFLEALKNAQLDFKDISSEEIEYLEITRKTLLQKKIVADKERLNKFQGINKILDKWLYIEQNGKRITDYFLKNDYRNVAVYGYGILGKHLVDELIADGIGVSYIIDRNPQKKDLRFKFMSIDSNLPEVDLVVITPLYDIYSIYLKLKECLSNPIITIEEIIHNYCDEFMVG